MMETVLDIRDLRVSIPTDHGLLHAVRGVDLSVRAGQTLCLVGESGCGKSLTAIALMGCCPAMPRPGRRALRCWGRITQASRLRRGRRCGGAACR